MIEPPPGLKAELKDMTMDELIAAPEKVQYLYWMALAEMPVGWGTVVEAMNNHPEYFMEK